MYTIEQHVLYVCMIIDAHILCPDMALGCLAMRSYSMRMY